MEAWFRDYVKWLLTSKGGQAEGNTTNNHAVWYDVQTATFALFAGQQDVARRILTAAPQRRIATQIEPDGTQPLELKRTKSLSYCLFNLETFFHLATLGDRLGIDLWNFRTSDGRSIRKAFDWVLPYTVGGQKWEHEQITKCDPEQMFPLLRRAANAYHEPRYEEMIGKLATDLARDRTHLLYPPSSDSKSPRRIRGR